MGEKKFNDITVIALATAAIVFGILFCLNGVMGSALDIIFGICFILLGLALTFLSLKNKFGVLSVQGISGGAIIALGITMIVFNGLTYYFIYCFVPFAFIVLGVFLIIEAFLLYFVRNEKNTVIFVIELIAGIILLTLGILAVSIKSVQFNAFHIIEGVMLILTGLYFIINKVVVKNNEE